MDRRGFFGGLVLAVLSLLGVRRKPQEPRSDLRTLHYGGRTYRKVRLIRYDRVLILGPDGEPIFYRHVFDFTAEEVTFDEA